MPSTTSKAHKSGASSSAKSSGAKSSGTKSSSSSSSRGKASATDAITLLTEDHKQVQKLFKEYEKLAEGEAADEERQAIAQQICTALTVHAQIEEELFYPAVRDAIDEEQLVDEAVVEHASAKDLIAQIESMAPDEPLYDAKVIVLGEYINHHIKEEQDEVFPLARKKIDTEALGERLMARRQDLMADLGMTEAGAEAEEEEE